MVKRRVAKDSPRIIAGELQRLVLGVRKPKKWPNNLYITTRCLGEFQEKSSLLIQKQTP